MDGSNYAILNKVDPRQLTGPLQLEATGQVRGVTGRAADSVASTAAGRSDAGEPGRIEDDGFRDQLRTSAGLGCLPGQRTRLIIVTK